MKKISLIIFDFDGVLADTFNIGLKLERVFNPEISEKEYRDYYDGNYFKNSSKQNIKKTNFNQVHFDLTKTVQISEKTKKLIKELSEKYKLVINSSSPEKSINHILEKNQIKRCFSKVYGRETSESKVKKFKIILAEFRLDLEEAIWITDTLGDILEAKEIGIKTIAFSNKISFSDQKNLKKGQPHKIITKLSEIKDFLDLSD